MKIWGYKCFQIISARRTGEVIRHSALCGQANRESSLGNAGSAHQPL